jgi:2-(1,2-epoxy-1,2-dihydrophenyl)acetyl-CoA isomerase
MSDIDLQIDGRVGILEVRRPPANYFDKHLIRQLVELSGRAVDEKGCWALVLASEGKHFCAGANFGDEDQEDRVLRSIELYSDAIRLFRIPVPVVAAVQGAAVGGGLGLACAADFRVATVQTRFHANFSHLGFHPGFGLSESLPFIVGPHQAHRLLTTGAKVGGEEALRIGLTDRLVESEDLRSTAVQWAQEIAWAAPLATKSIKATMRGDLADRVRRALDHELIEQTRLWQTEDSVRGIKASIARTKPEFVGR